MADSDEGTTLERALFRVTRAVGRLDLPPQVAGVALGKEAYWTLFNVEELGPMRASDLAAALKLDASSVSRQTHKLVAAGLIERRIDPIDGRACLLAVSERGREALTEAFSFRRVQLAELLGAWSDHDRGQLTAFLDRLADDLQQPPSAPEPGVRSARHGSAQVAQTS